MTVRVLIVDDSAVMRAVVQKTLAMSGVTLGEVYQAGNGAEALELLQRHTVDLVTLDISMPVMRGDEMLERLRALPALADLPVIAVSSERSCERVARMEELGAIFVQKPFSPEQMRSVLLGILTGRNELTAR